MSVQVLIIYTCTVPRCGNTHTTALSHMSVGSEIGCIPWVEGWRHNYGALICPKHKNVRIKVDDDAEIPL